MRWRWACRVSTPWRSPSGVPQTPPPLRLAVLLDLLNDPDSTTTHAVRKRLDRPRATVDRELQALHMLGLLTVDEVEVVGRKGEMTSVWHYALSDLADRDALRLLGSARNVLTRGVGVKKGRNADTPPWGFRHFWHHPHLRRLRHRARHRRP